MSWEIARMYALRDMEEEESAKRFADAINVYQDMSTSFSEEDGAYKVVGILGYNAIRLLKEIEEVFEEHEEYEKCAQISKWLNEVKKLLSF